MTKEFVVGADLLAKKLELLTAKEQRQAIRNAARAALLPVEKTARQLVPRGTRPHKTYKGKLVAPGYAASRHGINRTSGMSKDARVFYATVGTKKEAFYVRAFIEGVQKSRNKPQPWLRPAYEVNRVKVRRLFADKLQQQVIKKVAKRT